MIWQTLGIPRTTDRDTIRRAYAKKLRITNPEDDPQGFMALREAYESALEQLSWPAFDDEEPVTSPSGERSDSAPPSRERGQPNDPPADEPPTPEPDPLAAHQQALLTALQSPWPSPPEILLAHFDAILSSPQLESIAVQTDVENWLGHIIALHCPASDPLVAPAIAHFGWGSDASFRTPTSAAAAIAHRADVLAFVAVTSLPYRPLNLGWQALTKPPLHPRLMRLKAMMPDLADEVATLLEFAENRHAGIEDWFDPAALAWWQAHLARERVRAGHLALIPFAAVVAAIVGAAWQWPGWLTSIVALPALAAPWVGVRYIKQPQRDRAEAPWDFPAWQLTAWPAAMLALPVIAIILPGNGLGLILTALAALAVLVWTTIANPLPRGTGGWQRLGGIARQCWPFGVFAFLGMALMTPPRAIGWALVTLSLALCWWRAKDAITVAAARIIPPRIPQLLALPLATGVAVLVVAAGALAAVGTTPAEGLYRVYIATTAAMILLYTADRLADGGRIKLFVFIGWAVLLVTMFGAIGRAAPDRRDERATPLEIGSGVAAPAFTPAVCPLDTRAADNPGTALNVQICGSAAGWISWADYPERVARRGGQGVTGYELTIDDQGRVTDCLVTDSSGVGLLDEATCDLISQRARFLPARDANGIAVTGRYTSRVRWEMPKTG